METPEIGGYERLAGYMGIHPELGIFRRFSTLGFENLLYFQAELAQLEVSLRTIQEQDRKSGDEQRRRHGRAWSELSRPADSETQDNIGKEQYNLIMRLRAVMGQYGKTAFSF